jgi:uncharacterized protein YkwD
MRTLLLLSCLAASNALAADPASLLTERINAFRAEATSCNGAPADAVPPLSPQRQLAEVPIEAARALDALRSAGYAASVLRTLAIEGPHDVDAAMDALRQHYCQALRSRDYAEIGVSHSGDRWQVVLARPLLSDTPTDWRQAGQAVLAQVNEARSTARRCGEQAFDAAPPLAWSDRLGEAAHAHSSDMARHDFFDHRGHDGSTSAERAERAGYRWRRVGENIAAGIGSAEQAVDGWLASPQHCANLMNADFTEMGAAHAIEHDSRAVIYWTQVFGTPR